MKTSLILLFNFFLISVLCQNVPIDFEQNGNGLNWTWTTFENDINPPVEIVPNPDVSGLDTSSTVLKFTALQLGNPWAGFESMHGSDIGSFSFDSTNCTVKIMVWKSVISDVGIKFVDPTSAAQPEIKVSNTLVNRWEELTFDFSSRIGVYPVLKDQIVIFTDFDLAGRTQDNVVYIDNIYDTDSITNVNGLTQHFSKLSDIYPNPVSDVLFIENDKNKRLEIVDLHGKTQAFHTLISGSNNLDLSFLSNGIYLVKLYEKNYPSEIIKLIKN